MTIDEAEAILRADGRFDWLLDGPNMWSVKDLADAFTEGVGVRRSLATVLSWVRRLPESGRENYGGNTGFRARRSALIIFFAQGEHLHKSADEA